MTSYNVSHKFCDDGSMSSAIVKMFQPENTIVMTGYNDGWKKTEYKSGDYILFTDFCPKPEDLWDLYNQQIRFQVLDHHISSINNLFSDFSSFSLFPIFVVLFPIPYLSI